MNLKVTGKEIKVTDAINDYIQRKVGKLEKYFGEDFIALVTISKERDGQIAEMDINAKGENYRAVTKHRDLYASIDKDVDILEGQIRKAKTKKEKQIKENSIKQKDFLGGANQTPVIENEILKLKHYEIKPMTPEDALLKLQENPKCIFRVFNNVETGKTNVIYKLKDGKNYGIIEPEG